MPVKTITQEGFLFYAFDAMGKLIELGQLPSVEIETEGTEDAFANPFLGSDENKLTATFSSAYIILFRSNNWRKYHGLPMKRRAALRKDGRH